MIKIILILLVALVLESVGVVFLSSGLKQIGEPQRMTLPEIFRVIKLGATNRDLLIGVVLETVFFGTLLYLLSKRDVSLIWPLTSLGFVLTALVAKFYLREEVSWIRWTGVVLIVTGAAVITWSEKIKERHQEKTIVVSPSESQ